MRRISIIGSGGSGKSTFAKRLSDKLGIPVYHLDSMHWKTGWVATEREEWACLQRSLCAEKQWIIDGNYGSTLDIRLNSSDTVIFLDRNRFLCLYRALKRFFKYYGKNRPDMAEGCNEKLDFAFLKWIYCYPRNKRPGILAKLAQLDSGTKVYILQSTDDVESFLEQAGCV